MYFKRNTYTHACTHDVLTVTCNSNTTFACTDVAKIFFDNVHANVLHHLNVPAQRIVRGRSTQPHVAVVVLGVGYKHPWLGHARVHGQHKIDIHLIHVHPNFMDQFLHRVPIHSLPRQTKPTHGRSRFVVVVVERPALEQSTLCQPFLVVLVVGGCSIKATINSSNSSSNIVVSISVGDST